MNFMVSKALALSFCRIRQCYYFSYCTRPFGSATLNLACFTAWLAVCSMATPALVAQEKNTEVQSTAKIVEVPVTDAKTVAAEASEDLAGSLEAPVELPASDAPSMVSVSRASVLVGSFTVFLLAVFVGFEIITKVNMPF